jgi:hypothetical protein
MDQERAVDEAYENDLCADSFLKGIFNNHKPVMREIKIGMSYNRYMRSKE